MSRMYLCKAVEVNAEGDIAVASEGGECGRG